MRPDKYKSFAEMTANEEDYEIHSVCRDSQITVAAIHGGIEPGTERVAREIGAKFNTYVFEAFGEDSWDMHVTSNNYREDFLSQILGKSDVCLSLHGLHGGDEAVYISSSNKELDALVRQALEESEFVVKDYEPMGAQNFVNLATKGGVQLELTLGLRDSFFLEGARGSAITTRYASFCSAVTKALKEYEETL